MNNTVHISMGDVYSEVAYAPAAAWPIIQNACKAHPEGYFFMPKYKNGTWDGYISLVAGWKYIPTGLVQRVSKALTKEGFRTQLDEEPGFPPQAAIATFQALGPLAATILKDVALRDYQVDAVTKLLKSGRGVAGMATNSGKTLVFAAIIKLLGNANALVVVHTKDLLYQTAEKLSGYLDREVGLIGDEHKDDIDICVATIQTLGAWYKAVGPSQFKETFADNQVLVADEVHVTGSADKSWDILMHVPGWYRYGFSGTPLRGSVLRDLKLMALTGPVVVKVSNAELIEQGYSAVPIVFMHNIKRPAFAKQDYWNSDYQTAYTDCIVQDGYRNGIVADVAKTEAREGNSSLIIVSRIEQGERLLGMLDSKYTHIPAVFVQGASLMEQRKQALKWLGSGKTCIVIATPIFDEGVDVPALDTVIIACGGESHIKVLQRVGRGLRQKEGRNILHVHDFDDQTNEFLAKHSQARRKVYEDEGFEVRDN